jgi:hypothetical protein
MKGSLAVLALTTLLSGCVAEERVVYVQSGPPPESAAEVVAVAPGPDHVFIRGHWEWNGSRYAWVHSRYLHRPRALAVWVEGHWQSSPRGWYWQEGAWVDAQRVGKVKRARIYGAPGVPAAPPVVVEEGTAEVPLGAAPPAQTEAPPAQANVPPAPSYMPPPPPANRPPPPGAPGGIGPQRYTVGY